MTLRNFLYAGSNASIVFVSWYGSLSSYWEVEVSFVFITTLPLSCTSIGRSRKHHSFSLFFISSPCASSFSDGICLYANKMFFVCFFFFFFWVKNITKYFLAKLTPWITIYFITVSMCSRSLCTWNNRNVRRSEVMAQRAQRPSGLFLVSRYLLANARINWRKCVDAVDRDIRSHVFYRLLIFSVFLADYLYPMHERLDEIVSRIEALNVLC